MADGAGQAGAAPAFGINGLKSALQQKDIIFAMGVVGILIVLLLPVPTFLLDVLLGGSITFSVLILMTVLFIMRPLDFSAFPTILLIAAIFRLSLNIASTRLILSDGHIGPSAAGGVIEAFGGFVMAGSVVIGAIVFAILTIINFVVITKGSGRIAEVAARFSLDAMPGKQMAVDADLSAGLINEEEAKARRKELEDESTFFGAMDGASKFVRGDAIAGLLITFINFIGGMVIGIVQRDLSFGQAVESYTMLTIGDGLVSQIPSLVVSVSAGMLVSKAGAKGTANEVIFQQIGRYPQALGMSSFLMFLMAWMPAIPPLPFLTLSAICGYFAWKIYKNPPEDQDPLAGGAGPVGGAAGAAAALAGGAPGAAGGAAQGEGKEEEPISKVMQLDTLRIELGYGLLPLVNYEKGTRLPEQVKALRKQLARDMGFVIPAVRIQDNMQLTSNEYVLRVKDIECGRGEVRPDMLLVMNPAGGDIELPGDDTKEPAFGLPAKWIGEGVREEAVFRNYTVVDPPTVITTHLTEVVKENIVELMTFSEAKKLIDSLQEEHGKLLEDTIPDKVSVGMVQRILQGLLAEYVSIRDLSTIMEGILEGAENTKNVILITEHVRSKLARQICNDNLSPNGQLEVLSLSPVWEQIFSEGLTGDGEQKQLSVPPTRLQEFINGVKRTFQQHNMKGENPVLLVSPLLRPYVRSVVERFRPMTVVLSQNEVHSKVAIKTLGQI